MTRSAAFPAVLDDLQIGSWTGLLGAEEHANIARWVAISVASRTALRKHVGDPA